MPNPSPCWEENEYFLANIKPLVDIDRGPLSPKPIAFRAWSDLHEALATLPNKQQWLRDKVYAAAKEEGLL